MGSPGVTAPWGVPSTSNVVTASRDISAFGETADGETSGAAEAFSEISDFGDSLALKMASIVGDAPAVGDVPAAVGDLPAAVGDVPAAVGDLPAADGDLPAADGDLPAAVGDVPAVGDAALIFGLASCET
jgi:hypothetical protein